MIKTSRDHLLYAFRRVMRPLIRILVRSGVRYDDFLELVRGVYVESAIRDGLGDGITPTRAKISVSTGVPRRDVDRFIDNDGALPPVATSLAATLSEVLNKWHTDPLFVGPYGIPLELEVKGGKARSFIELVGAVNPSVNAHDVLDELMRFRAAVWSGDTHVRAISRACIPVEEMSPAQLELFGNALTRLANTLQYNLDRLNSDKRLERSVIADRGLPSNAVPIFEKHVRERVSELLIDLDNWLSQYPVQDQQGVRFERVGVAVFQFVEPIADSVSLRDRVAAQPDDRSGKPNH
jgi:hypothetical protein